MMYDCFCPKKRPVDTSSNKFSRLGGVVFSVLATGPKGRGFKPSRGDGFLRAIKNRSTPSFGRKVKPEVSRCKILRHVKKIPWGISDTNRKNFNSLVHSSYLPQISMLVGLPETSGGRVRSYPSWHHHHHGSPLITWGMNNRPVGGCSSETQSHPIINNQSINKFPEASVQKPMKSLLRRAVSYQRSPELLTDERQEDGKEMPFWSNRECKLNKLFLQNATSITSSQTYRDISKVRIMGQHVGMSVWHTIRSTMAVTTSAIQVRPISKNIQVGILNMKMFVIPWLSFVTQTTELEWRTASC
jgi:hypothetical protein